MSERPRIDMSPAAIDRRLRELAQLYRLGRSLAQARRLGKVEPAADDERKPKQT